MTSAPDPDPTTFRSLRDQVAALLDRAGVPDPEVDAELLIGHVIGEGRGRVQALVAMDSAVDPSIRDAVLGLADRRARHASRCSTSPAALRSGRSSCRSARASSCRARRPSRSRSSRSMRSRCRLAEPIGVDLGTGSGAIALAMATEVPHARIFASRTRRRPSSGRGELRRVRSDERARRLRRPRRRAPRARRHGRRRDLEPAVHPG